MSYAVITRSLVYTEQRINDLIACIQETYGDEETEHTRRALIKALKALRVAGKHYEHFLAARSTQKGG